MDITVYRLVLLVILCRMAHCASTTPPNLEPEDFQPEGVIVNDGGTGEGETNVHKHQNDLEHKKENLFSNHAGEMIQHQYEEEYIDWLQVCADDNITPPDIPDGVSEYLKSNNMSTEDLFKRCETMKSGHGKRGKRFLKKSAGVWDKCIIPFKFDESYVPENRVEALRVHKMLRLETGFRFVEYNNTNKEMGLNHNNYLIYWKGSNCASGVGNNRGSGQWISACGSFSVILHELGHAMGLMHESNDPAGLYSGLMHVNFNNLVEKYWSTYHITDVYKDELFYELTSYMSAGNYGTLRGYGPWISIDEPELTKLIAYGDYFYSMMEVQKFHKCYDEFSSCSTLPVCEMGGYASVVKGVCACACPEGLDPAKKCSTLKDVINSGSWPAGTFSLLKVKDTSCPKGFSDGQMARWNIEKIWTEGTSLSEGNKDNYEFVFDVCTQKSSSGSGEWPAGEYCLLKKGNCPNGFEEGLIETLGKVPQRDNSSFGALPDGKKGQDFEFRFCCRNDGHYTIPISLPNREPFIMYTKYYSSCQKVEGMTETREKYVTTQDVSKTLVFNGSIPYYWNKYKNTYFTYYCVYKPLNSDGPCGGIKKFSSGETTFTFTSPKYPNNYSKDSECLWYFESPKGTTMKIEFSDFEVSTVNDAECKSYVELRTVLPGSSGYRMCGHYEKKSRLTVYNTLTVKLLTSTNEQQKGFKATVTVLSESDQCYKGDGSKTYAGKMSYTRSFRPCVPWSKVPHCILHQFSHSTAGQDLSNNHCRNSGFGRMPWCYVNAELCERENCDVCMRDQCFDVLPNCASVVQDDAQFCTKNEFGEAKRGCMKTCGFCEQFKQKQAYPTVTCPAPGAVTEIDPSPAKASYQVGDQVSYACPTSEVVRKRTCQSDGTWSPLGFVCSGCFDGWSYIRGRCFQYQPTEKLNYEDTKKLCEGLKGNVAVVDSDEQATEVMELVFKDIANNFGYIYIGLKYQDGAWVGEDGSKPSYISWDPAYKQTLSYCVIGKGYKKIYTSWCGYKREVMCSHKITGPFVCEDDVPNCVDIIENNPGMCEEYPDYAWTNCRKTCGVPGCTETSSCTVPSVDNAKQVHGSSDSIKQGQYIEYKCNDGFLLKSGNLNRTCLSTNTFNGNPPMCVEPTEVGSITLFSDVELFRRDTYLSSYFNYLEVANLDTTRITVAGKVKAWEFFASEAGEVTMLIWRPNAKNTLEFTLVGKNTLNVKADNRAVRMDVNAEEQIPVKVGDVIGLVLPSKPVITFSECTKKNVPQFAPWLTTLSKYYAADMVVGKAFTFKEYDKSCRVYSIHVIVSPTA